MGSVFFCQTFSDYLTNKTWPYNAAGKEPHSFRNFGTSLPNASMRSIFSKVNVFATSLLVFDRFVPSGLSLLEVYWLQPFWPNAANRSLNHLSAYWFHTHDWNLEKIVVMLDHMTRSCATSSLTFAPRHLCKRDWQYPWAHSTKSVLSGPKIAMSAKNRLTSRIFAVAQGSSICMSLSM